MTNFTKVIGALTRKSAIRRARADAGRNTVLVISKAHVSKRHGTGWYEIHGSVHERKRSKR